MIFVKIIIHLSQNSKVKCEKSFYFSYHNCELTTVFPISEKKMCIYALNRKKKSLFQNFACKKISYFDKPAVKKVHVWPIFSKISAYLHMQLQINEHLKNISHEKIPFCQYSVKYLCIFYVIQKLNVRK